MNLSIRCAINLSYVNVALMSGQAVVLEGNYWKRRLESVTSEYKKWRRFFIDHPTYGRTAQEKNPLGGEKNCMDEVRYLRCLMSLFWNVLVIRQSSQ